MADKEQEQPPYLRFWRIHPSGSLGDEGMKKQNAKRESFWKRLTKKQLRLLRGGDGDSSSSDSSSASTSAGGVVPGPLTSDPPATGGR